jgi:hypothetical protein
MDINKFYKENESVFRYCIENGFLCSLKNNHRVTWTDWIINDIYLYNFNDHYTRYYGDDDYFLVYIYHDKTLNHITFPSGYVMNTTRVIKKSIIILVARRMKIEKILKNNLEIKK